MIHADRRTRSFCELSMHTERICQLGNFHVLVRECDDDGQRDDIGHLDQCKSKWDQLISHNHPYEHTHFERIFSELKDGSVK